MSHDTSHAGTCPAKYLKLRSYLERNQFNCTLSISKIKFGLRRSFPELLSSAEMTSGYFLNSLFDLLGLKSPVCATCGSIVTFNPKIGDFRKFCSVSCSANNAVTREKFKATCLEKYGKDNPTKSVDIIAKVKKTNLHKYGCECSMKNAKVRAKAVATSLRKYGTRNPRQNAVVKQKAEQTCLEIYGHENPMQALSVRKKTRNTWLKNHGGVHPSSTKKVKEKKAATSRSRYGVDNPMQNQVVMNKSHRSAFKLKEFVSITGRVHEYQGYENIVLKLLDKRKDVASYRTAASGLLPKFEYSGSHEYTPDIGVKFKNGDQALIEVKCGWTLFGRDWKRNLLKFKSVEESLRDYKSTTFWLAITDSKGNVEWVENPFANRRKLK